MLDYVVTHFGIITDLVFFFFKQKTAYEMRIMDWSSDVCSSDLPEPHDELSLPATRESKGLLDLQFHGACYRLVINQGLLSHKPRRLSRVIFRVSKINLAACR